MSGPGLHPFNYGNAIGQAQNILNARTKNQLMQQELSQNALNPGGSSEFGITPIYTKGPDGKIRIFQLNKGGGGQEFVLPEGQEPAIPGKVVDFGSYLQFVNKYGQGGQPPPSTTPSEQPQTGTPPAVTPQQPPVAQNQFAPTPKTLPPEKTIKHLTDVAKVKTEAAIATEIGKSEVKNKWGGIIAQTIKLAEAAAAERGEVLNDVARMKASMPGLKASIVELKKLNKIATHTVVGKIWNAAVREAGFGATEGATARARFISIIDNQVLPLLRQTFGAAFTKEEGKWLKATMGDPDLTPEEKNAQLDAFIAQKIRNIEAKELQLGQSPVLQEPAAATQNQPQDDPLGLFK